MYRMFHKKLVEKKDTEEALKRLDNLMQDEARMAAAQFLNLTHAIDDKVTSVRDRSKEVDEKMDDVLRRKLACYFLSMLP